MTDAQAAHRPRRGSDVEAWIKETRDSHNYHDDTWHALDALLDDYRLKADVGASLDQEVEGPAWM